MSVLSPNQVSMEAANALASHLRTNPQDANRPPGELAAQFGLSGEFVRTLIAGVHKPQHPHAARKPFALSFVGRAASRIGRGIDRAIARPVPFVVATTLVGIVTSFAASRMTSNVAGEAIFLAVFAAHLGAYFRLQKSRNALYGAIAIFATITPILLAIALIDRAGAAAVAESTFGMFILSFLYAGFGSLMAVLGAFRALKLKDRRSLSLSRQELLERYFDLQARLQQGTGDREPKLALTEAPLVEFYRRHPFLTPVAFGVGLRVVTVLLSSTSIPAALGHATSGWQIVAMLLSGILSFAAVLFFVVIGFFAKSLTNALASAVAYAVAWYSALALPFMGSGIERLDTAFRSGSTYAILALALAATAVAAMGAMVQTRSQRERDIQANDTAAVLAEMVQIQWRLADRTTTVCVMVVDAAKSSEMKSGEDPLAIEYSFREYQDWLAAESGTQGGRVHSTAGDGAVIAFDCPQSAMNAAINVQHGLAAFNARANRLSRPFRLRVGLHSGSIAGNLQDVEFTEIIDIAAHVEAAAPIGGIALTEAVAAGLDGIASRELGRLVDGLPVFVVHGEDI